MNVADILVADLTRAAAWTQKLDTTGMCKTHVSLLKPVCNAITARAESMRGAGATMCWTVDPHQVITNMQERVVTSEWQNNASEEAGAILVCQGLGRKE